MDNNTENPPDKNSDSPKPLAFTIDFGNNQNAEAQTQRQKALAEKFQKRHKRGQSLSKLEESPTTTPPKQHPLTGNLPRKSSFQSEGYFSADEKPDRVKSANARMGSASVKRSDLSLALKNVTSERMTQSFPNSALPCITSPQIELKDVSSPELDPTSPFSPKEQSSSQDSSCNSIKKTPFLSPDCEILYIGENTDEEIFVDGTEFHFDKSDTASDTGTYTLDADNYSEEQKARMSIDREFKIEQVSVQKKTEEYVKSLATMRDNVLQNAVMMSQRNITKEHEVAKGIYALNLNTDNILKSPRSPTLKKFGSVAQIQSQTKLSPILSPTQNISITDIEDVEDSLNNSDLNNTFTKIMYPSPNAKRDGLKQAYDQGSVISVTSSGAFKKVEKKDKLSSLTKSEVQVEAYIDGKGYSDGFYEHTSQRESKKMTPKLTTTIVNVQSIDVQSSVDASGVLSANIVVTPKSVNNLPPAIGGYSSKVSSSKIPSPTHMVSRPRSRNSISSLNLEFSDNSLDTDEILKPTQNYINSLQQRLSLDSDQDSDYDVRTQLNNTAHILKQKASHTRHNSLDDRTMNISNKLEHFQNKNLLTIDQTYSNLLNQYSQNRVMHKIQNSPNNSPIRRSSSFSAKGQILSTKNTNVVQKESNIRNSPNPTRNTNVHRSTSATYAKPNYIVNTRGRNGDHQKIDRSQYGDTESSSEEDFAKNNQNPSKITNTRCNRAFSLRRAQADGHNEPPLKCSNTPEMRRKFFQPDLKHERAISVDRKPMKTNEIQSRYLLNISKKTSSPAIPKDAKIVPKVTNTPKAATPSRPQGFARTESGRYSMRTNNRPPITNSTTKGPKKDSSGKKQGGIRSNSSLSSRELEFQNWKRRKSYDPMKAAAEGKKKEQAKRQSVGAGQNAMTQSYTEANLSQDSSPSHSSSVHRSQSFHGTAALEQLISSDEEAEEDDLTLSADEGFSPPTPSPCELSPARATLRHTLWERIRH